MAITFNKLKTKLGLLDFIPIGKYRQCRVDSIIAQDHEYLIYMDKEGILKYTDEVLDALKNKFSATSIPVTRYYRDSFDCINGHDMAAVGFEDDEYYDDDIPF